LLEDAYDAYKKAIDLKDVKFRDQESVYNNMKILSNNFINRGADQFQAQQYALAYQSFSKLEDMNNFFSANGQKFPHDISNVRSNAALCAQKAGMTKEAITLYEGVVSKGSDDANLYYTLSQLYKADGRDADAKKLLDDAVTKFPNNINLLISQLNYYLAENKHEEALEKLKKAISLDPKNDQLYVAAGIAFDKIKDTAQCREMYRKAIEVNPKNLNAWNNIGVTYVDEANIFIKEINTLGNSEADKKRYEELKKKRDASYRAAKPFLEKVIELDPTNEQVKRVMAKVNSSLAD
jgi:tetratricopeptide (TPR) repeat protein